MLYHTFERAPMSSSHGNEHPTQFRKLCSKCKAIKPTEDFFKDRSKPDGLYSQCKVCSASEERRRREAKNPPPRPTGVTKTCTRCKLVKAMGDFCQNKRSSDGLYSQCRSCVADKDRERRTKTLATKAEVVPEKCCSRCGQTKPSSEFYKDSSKHDGLQTYCKPCLCQKHKDQRLKKSTNKEKSKKAQPSGEATADLGPSPLFQDEHPQDLGAFDLNYFGDAPQLINHHTMTHELPNNGLHMQHMPAGEFSIPLNSHRFMQNFPVMPGVPLHHPVRLDLSMAQQRVDEKAQQTHSQMLNGNSMQLPNHAVTSILAHAALQRGEMGMVATAGLGVDPRQGIDHFRGPAAHRPQDPHDHGQVQPSFQPSEGPVCAVCGNVCPDNDQAVQHERAHQADQQMSSLSSVGGAGVVPHPNGGSIKTLPSAECARHSSRLRQDLDAAQSSVAREGGSQTIHQPTGSGLLIESDKVGSVGVPPAYQADGLLDRSLGDLDPPRGCGDGSGVGPARSSTGDGLSDGLLLQHPSGVDHMDNLLDAGLTPLHSLASNSLGRLGSDGHEHMSIDINPLGLQSVSIDHLQCLQSDEEPLS